MFNMTVGLVTFGVVALTALQLQRMVRVCFSIFAESYSAIIASDIAHTTLNLIGTLFFSMCSFDGLIKLAARVNH